jgi:hypothetical protein
LETGRLRLPPARKRDNLLPYQKIVNGKLNDFKKKRESRALCRKANGMTVQPPLYSRAEHDKSSQE